MPEQISKYPEVTLQVLKGAGAVSWSVGVGNTNALRPRSPLAGPRPHDVSPQPRTLEPCWSRRHSFRVAAQGHGSRARPGAQGFDDDDDRQPDDPSDMEPSKEGSSVGVPSHYFRIFIRQSGNEIESISFIIPNSDRVPGRNSSDATRDKFLKRSIRRVNQILERAGVDLFPEMPAGEKDSLKTFRAPDLWPTN